MLVQQELLGVPLRLLYLLAEDEVVVVGAYRFPERVVLIDILVRREPVVLV